MSEVFLDTETTGLSFREGHKIVEIACIETKDLIATGKVFHKLINPQRSVPDEAFKVHGFSQEFLKDKERFKQIADEFLNFIKDKKIIIKKNKALILGNTSFKAAELMSSDLRASVALVLAAMVAKGSSIINRIYHLDRGYEFLEKKLKSCKAEIRRL